LFTVILNPKSGSSSNADAERLVQLFRAEGAEIKIVTLAPERVEAMIREAVPPDDARGHLSADGKAANRGNAVVAAGGDGTVSSVAAALAGGPTPLGILPLGTLNHFAKDLRISMDEAQAVKTIVAGHVAAVDVAYVNERIFINNSSIGVYPGTVELREELRRQGHNKWTALAIASAKVLARDTEVSLRVAVDGRTVVTRTPFLFVGNNEYTTEGIHLGARARIDAGRLYAYLAPRMHTRDLPKLFLWALLGHARSHGAFATFSALEMWIETPQRRVVRVATDGEITSLSTPLHYRVAPRALNVLVPAS
jgi:diacylglycerol kinase family enzyme